MRLIKLAIFAIISFSVTYGAAVVSGQVDTPRALETLPSPIELQSPQAFEPHAYTNSYDGQSVRIKDITRREGTRTNKLTGIGLVVGLNGSGSKSPQTRQFALNLLERFDLRADPDQRATIRTSGLDKSDNLSVVTVTADVDEVLHKEGNKFDITIATLDDATSLQGGVLMLTPLYGVDGEVHALASGSVSIGGFSFSGDAASVQQNHPTTGRIANGATIEKTLCTTPVAPLTHFRLNLLSPDLETASRITNAINVMWSRHCHLYDAGAVDVIVPREFLENPLQFVAVVEALRVIPDENAKVVINERTGTVILGDNVRISKVAINHANLTVVTGELPQVSQPAPFSNGVTAVVPRTSIDVTEGSAPISVFEKPVTVGELARALNALGVTPRDLSSIFQQLKSAGALHADLIIQ